jgi:hypothetical protein
MRHPHSRCESFTTDVAKRKHQAIRPFFNTEEVARQMAHCENLARNIESSVTHKTRRTQSPMHLCGLEDRSVQLRVISLEGFEPGIRGDNKVFV